LIAGSARWTYGTSDLDEAADAIQASIRPQVIGWYVLIGLAAWPRWRSSGEAMARQTAAERADHSALSALGVGPASSYAAGLLRTLLTGRGRGRGGRADRRCSASR
jgi:hypothetical protein